MRTSPVDACAARVETQVQIIMPHDVSSGFRKRSRSRFLNAQRCMVEHLGANRQQITMVIRALLLERKELAAVCVANQRREAVGAEVSPDVEEHRAKFAPVFLFDGDSILTAQEK